MGSCPHCECFLRKDQTCLKAKCIEAEKEELRGKERRLEFENRKHDIMIKMLEKQNEPITESNCWHWGQHGGHGKGHGQS